MIFKNYLDPLFIHQCHEDNMLERYHSSLEWEKKKLLYIFVYSYKKWVSMTTYLSSELLHELQPLCGTIASGTRFETMSSNTKSRREEAEAHKHTCSKVKRTPEVLEQDNCLFVLRFYGPVNPMGSCRARSVYLTTRLLDRLSPLSG